MAGQRPTNAAAKRGRSNEPMMALLLTWFLPGAGHLYLGRTALGVTLLVVVEGIYALGWWLSEGRAFELLDPELRGPLATILTPEFGNLGAMIAQLRTVGYGSAELTPLPPLMVQGMMLTALSGVANFLCMAHAHQLARTPEDAPREGPHPILLLTAGWAVPGLGHLLQGRRLRGAIVFATLVGLFALGTWMAEGTNLSRERHFYYWSGQVVLGLPALVAELVWGDAAVTHTIPRMDFGLLYACMAGLLNMLALLDVERFAAIRWMGQVEESGAEDASAEGGEAAGDARTGEATRAAATERTGGGVTP